MSFLPDLFFHFLLTRSEFHERLRAASCKMQNAKSATSTSMLRPWRSPLRRRILWIRDSPLQTSRGSSNLMTLMQTRGLLYELLDSYRMDSAQPQESEKSSCPGEEYPLKRANSSSR